VEGFILDATLQVERSKVELQTKFFEAQMSYQRERDIRLGEHALLTHKNVRLSILKQHDMVHCLQELIVLLGAGLFGNAYSRSELDSTHGHEQQSRF